MKTITFYVVALLCLCATKLCAQTFSDRANAIGDKIELITKQQKDSLKTEVEAVNVQLEKNEITTAQADSKKQELAQKRANNIETLVAVEQQKLDDLVKDKVDGKIEEDKNGRRFTFKYDTKSRSVKDSIKKVYEYKRTQSQLVFAIGVNRLMNDGNADKNFKWRSDFYEWGVSWNTRILKENNLLHAKYGLSLQYNNLRPDGDRVFAKDGARTILVDAGRDIDVARLRYVNLVIPAHLEFDFAKKKVNGDKTYFPIQRGFRLGVGGYVGLNVKEKQIIKFEDDNGNNVKDRTKGNYNVNDFVYGVSAYVGYRDISLYAKYDLQPVFSNNEIDQNNLSLGIRFDFN
ncbi:hypothetical protein Q765_11140 [Flavobacterium rivuli WB 3.3-2 = DSM 21788]|uniref:Outer membrane protein beta-barrel domain-containing protein n=1 Tax=Flavobacterium rivuli WB 3.3-2 = DSM 21788 TaxID=1121895 RepID=A0A0A2M1A6_9FLAO|nr:hypothetical protein [Flavobacterium rivuli]KGO86427.1 hypothetical protein Q765_11140 [Flavobacterium rivuli WB 3.3-2 = DSM 21788]